MPLINCRGIISAKFNVDLCIAPITLPFFHTWSPNPRRSLWLSWFKCWNHEPAFGELQQHMDTYRAEWIVENLLLYFPLKSFRLKLQSFLYSYLRLYVDIYIRLHHFSVVFAKPLLLLLRDLNKCLLSSIKRACLITQIVELVKETLWTIFTMQITNKQNILQTYIERET